MKTRYGPCNLFECVFNVTDWQRSGALAKAEKEKAAARAVLQKARDKLAELRQQMDELVLEEQALQTERNGIMNSMSTIEAAIETATAEYEKAETVMHNCKNAYESAAET